ncbi:precorrin-2 C(20)-methyltransferase [Synechococcus sp. RSCCF101]|nr:precorrin-2 C(20)-methyltransferase [Synechococcus sp. RSCCF101]QEY33438.1 precorrin-2 C(20)-methyltransferase [Synechococcus sp. RSCCF101]
MGVGPGDPELLTVAAVRAIAAAGVVAYPISAEGAASMAAAIAAPWIGPEQRRLPLLMPVVEAAEPRRRAWREACDRLAREVEAGAAVVFLCEGDVSLYATAAYVLMALRRHHPACPVALIPGITSMAAAAARGAWPLALQREQLLITPTPDTGEDMDSLLITAARANRVLVLLKLGRRWRWLRPLLEARGLLEGALLARRVGWPDELIAPAAAVPAAELPYFSLLLLRQGRAEVLP